MGEAGSAGAADVEVLLDLLAGPARAEAERVFERAVVRGLFGEAELLAVLERRRAAALAAAAVPPIPGAPCALVKASES